MSNGPFGGPFNPRDLFGTDRLKFTNVIVGDVSLATPQQQERAEEIYRDSTIHPSAPNESNGAVRIINGETFEVDVTLYQPLVSLSGVRDARNKLDSVTPESTVTVVDVKSINVGVTDRERAILAKNIWLEFGATSIIELDPQTEANLEAKIREEIDFISRINLLGQRGNIAVNTGTEKRELHALIEFSSEVGDILRDELDIKIRGVRMSPGDKFGFSF